MTFPDHYREPNVATCPQYGAMDYIGLERPWPQGVTPPAGAQDLGTAGAIVRDGRLVEVDDVGEWGWLVPAGWKP